MGTEIKLYNFRICVDRCGYRCCNCSRVDDIRVSLEVGGTNGRRCCRAQHDGNIIPRRSGPFDNNDFVVWSMTSTVLSLLIGLLLDRPTFITLSY